MKYIIIAITIQAIAIIMKPPLGSPSPPVALAGPGRPSVKHSLSVQVLCELLSSESSRRIAISWLKMHSQGSQPPSAILAALVDLSVSSGLTLSAVFQPACTAPLPG